MTEDETSPHAPLTAAPEPTEATGAPERVLLLGGGGLLGTALAPTLRRAMVAVDAPPRQAVDLTDLDQVRKAVEDHRPDLLINTAAQSKVDLAEREPDRAFVVNALGAQNAALAAAEAEIPLLHVSTDYVFDGETDRPYREVDPTGLPPSQYGQSKLLGEQLVRDSAPRHFIVRVAVLFGPGRNDFVDWVLEAADPKKPLTIVDDRTVSPTWTEDLARQLLALIATPYWGTYHATGHGTTTWYGLAQRVLSLTGRNWAGIVPVSDAELRQRLGGTTAARPRYSALENHLLRLRGLDTMMAWDEALAAYLQTRTQ